MGLPPVPAEGAPFVAPLDAFTRADIGTAGGKGANLGELLRAGFEVPPGFVLTTAAYEHFAAESGLHAQLGALSGPDTGAAGTRQAFISAALPDDIAEALSAAYRMLGSGTVAVRSSATAEDLPSAAFAGQQETYLGVVGEEALLQAVRRCWASLWSERAIAYRRQHGLKDAGVKMAVVVQSLVLADVAGVLFTANPVTGSRDEVVIDASLGLGEAVVAGLVTPDHYVVRKRRLKIKERRVGRREVVIRAREGGGTEQTHPAAPGDAAVLPDEDIRQLARLGIAIEQHYGAPQDVEWARANGRTYVVQARPITALRLSGPATTSAGRKRPSPPNFTGEIFPIRPYPLDLTTHTSTILKAIGDAMAGPLGVKFPTVERSMVVQDGVAVRLGNFAPRPTLRILYKPWLSLWQRRQYDLARWRDDPIIAQAVQRAHSLEARDLPALSWGDLLRTLREALALEPFVAQLRDRYLPLGMRDTALLSLHLRLTGRHRQFTVLTSGVENKTLDLNRALEELAHVIRSGDVLRARFADTTAAALPEALASEPEAQPFLAAFQTFLRDYGHRESVVSLMSQPTWKDAPEIPLGILKTLAASELRTTPAGLPEWERARNEILAHSILGWRPMRKIFLKLLERARRFAQVREDTHFYLTLPMPVERRCALELGRRLAEAGILERADDVFHLTLEELETAGKPWPPRPEIAQQLVAVVADRKARREALAGELFVEPGLLPPEPVAGALLTGMPGSAGIAEGPVCIVHSPAEFGKLQAGDVLVAPFTNPAWTPLFARAAAVVADTGGPMSHAAIVAREYGVPAVMGARDGTTKLADGQRVRVDGNRGLVFAVAEIV